MGSGNQSVVRGGRERDTFTQADLLASLIESSTQLVQQSIILNRQNPYKRRKTDRAVMVSAGAGALPAALPAANEAAVGIYPDNGEQGDQPAAVFRQGASQLATVLAANGMSDEATGGVMPNYVRVLVDEVGQAAVDQAVADNERAGPNKKTGAALTKHLKEVRRAAEKQKLVEVSALSLAEIKDLIAVRAHIDVPQLVVGDADKPLMNWALMRAFHTELTGNPAAKTNKGAVAALECFLEEAADLYKVQCRACSGYGHTAEYCPTLPRLQAAIGANPTVKCWLGRAVKRPYKNVRVGVDKAPAMLHLPYKLPNGFKNKDGNLKKHVLD